MQLPITQFSVSLAQSTQLTTWQTTECIHPRYQCDIPQIRTFIGTVTTNKGFSVQSHLTLLWAILVIRKCRFIQYGKSNVDITIPQLLYLDEKSLGKKYCAHTIPMAVLHAVSSSSAYAHAQSGREANHWGRQTLPHVFLRMC